MIKEIRSLSNQRLSVIILRSDNRFRSFLANLLQNLVESLIKEVARVGAFRSFTLSRFNQRVKTGKHIAQVRRALLRSRHFTVKAGTCAGVARWTIRMDQHRERITVTVNLDIHNSLCVSGSLAFVPQTRT